MPEDHISMMVAENDRKNQAAINRALEAGRINAEAAEYLTVLYSDSIDRFREVFHVLGKCFGAPKAAVTPYDYSRGKAVDERMNISDISPMSPYMVHHRLDADPMRNQFFSAVQGHKVELSVSSIVSVIVGAQKKINRSLDKIQEYYEKYVEEVAATAERVIASYDRVASGRAIADKIRHEFGNRFITTASETVLKIIGGRYEKIAVDLVRELDKITKPHLRLRDVWRVKCLFDLIPQARTFIERIYEVAPDKILNINDKFYDINNPRNYRDAKVILNIGQNGDIVPLEIMCQVRTLFEYERANHSEYESVRKSGKNNPEIEEKMANGMEQGIIEYNTMICDCLDDLFDRVGWNILYNQGRGDMLFDGFPRISKQYYPHKIVDTILEKIDNAVENEVFAVTSAPVKLTPIQETEIFRWMAQFILLAAMPYKNGNKVEACDGMPGKFFNFVMNELQRYYKK